MTKIDIKGIRERVERARNSIPGDRAPYEIVRDAEFMLNRIEYMARCLKFYAEKNNWEKIPGHTNWASNLRVQDCSLYNSGGGRARAVLKELGLE